MSEVLKACPLCGKAQEPQFYDRGERSSYWFVSCNGEEGEHQVRAVGNTEAEAITAWNTRPAVATDEGVVRLVEAAQAVVDEDADEAYMVGVSRTNFDKLSAAISAMARDVRGDGE